MIAIRRLVDGYLKLMCPDGVYTKEDVEQALTLSVEMRRRVNEQLKKLGGMEFFDVNFSYIDREAFEQHCLSVPEQGGSNLIPEGIMKPGQVCTVSRGKSAMLGVFRLETQMLLGSAKLIRAGRGSSREAKEATNSALISSSRTRAVSVGPSA